MVENPDAVSVVGAFASGATLTALFSGAIKNGEPCLTVHGDRGSVTCRPNAPGIRLRRGEEDTHYVVCESERGTWRVERDFVDAVRGGVKGKPSFEDGVGYMAVTEAVMKAARSGAREEVPVSVIGGEGRGGLGRRRAACSVECDCWGGICA